MLRKLRRRLFNFARSPFRSSARLHAKVSTEIDLRVGTGGSEYAGLSLSEIELVQAFQKVSTAQLQDEKRIHDFVRRMVARDRRTLPSGMRVLRSWFYNYRFFLEARWKGRVVILASAEIDRGYALNTIWFIDTGIACATVENGVDLPTLQDFILRYSRREQRQEPARSGSRVVFGFPHMLHMLWNGLPALISFARQGVPANTEVDFLFQPFGPLTELVPELQGRLRQLDYRQAVREGIKFQVSWGIGGWLISQEAQARICSFARKAVSDFWLSERDRLDRTFSLIFWITTKPGNRTLVEEPSVIAELITQLAERYPTAGFILDGASTPWDFRENANYNGFFRDHIEALVSKSQEQIDQIKAGCASIANRIVALNGISIVDEIVLAELADFYVAHGGSMQHKIGWIHNTPGFVHSNRRFLSVFRAMPRALEADVPVFFPTESLFVDEDSSQLSALDLARKDECYHTSDVSKFVSEVASAFEATRLGSWSQ